MPRQKKDDLPNILHAVIVPNNNNIFLIHSTK